MQMFEPDDYMFTFDLKAGYHHVDIYKQHWDYLGFSWGEGTTQQYYIFLCPPIWPSHSLFSPYQIVTLPSKSIGEVRA